MLAILLLDDSPDDRLIAARELEQAFPDLEIRSVTDTEQLKQALEEGGFDCVVTDYQLRWSDGLQVLKAVKARYPLCPVVMYTDSGSEEVAVAGMKAGLSDYVLKGRPVQRLSIAVQESLFKQRLQQQCDAAIAQLSISEERLRLALDAASMGNWDWNLETNEIIWCENHARLFGVEPSRFDGTYESVFACLHPDDRVRVHQSVCRARDAQIDYQEEYRVVWADSSEHWISARGKFFYDAIGRATRMIGMVIDISDRKQAEVEQARLLQMEQAARTAAETANRLKDEFLATLSHELRSPLNAILGWAQLLRIGRLNAERRAQALETIERNAKLQTQLIEDLLDISRIIRGNLPLNVTAVDLSAPIEAAIETMRLAAEAKATDVQWQRVEGVRVAGDANRLQQIIWNLLSNAIKFTPEGGQVRVSLSTDPSDAQAATSHALITVADTGEGIPAGFLPLVFESFRQADATLTRLHGGLGLGLAIVRHLVELHGGTIRAASLGEGHGATFTVRLPLWRSGNRAIEPDHDMAAPLPVSASRPHSTDRPSAAPLAGVRVLLVDDEPDSRDYLQFVLEEAGAAVAVCDSAAAALRAIAPFQPDLIVSDLGMPEQDGYGFLGELQRQHAALGSLRPLIPAIALTAYARAEDRSRTLAAGFQQHLTKPVSPEALVEAVLSCLSPLSKKTQHF